MKAQQHGPISWLRFFSGNAESVVIHAGAKPQVVRLNEPVPDILWPFGIEPLPSYSIENASEEPITEEEFFAEVSTIVATKELQAELYSHRGVNVNLTSTDGSTYDAHLTGRKVGAHRLLSMVIRKHSIFGM